MKYVIPVVLGLLLMTISAISEQWQQIPASYYNRHTAVLRAEMLRCENMVAYRLSIALNDSNSGAIEIIPVIGDSFYVGEQIIGDSLGAFATVDSFPAAPGLTLYISNLSGQLFVSDSIEGQDSSGRAIVTLLDLTSHLSSQIYIPTCGANSALIIWEVENFVQDSIYMKMQYGSGWGSDTDETVYYVDDLIDSSLYWYKEQDKTTLDLTEGFFPAPFLVLDVSGAWSNCFSGTLELRIMVSYNAE